MKNETFVLSKLGVVVLTIIDLVLFMIPIVNRALNQDTSITIAIIALLLTIPTVKGWISQAETKCKGRAIPFEDIVDKYKKFHKIRSTDGMEMQNLHIIKCDGGHALLVHSNEEIPDGAFTVGLEHTPDKRLFYPDVS